MPEQPSQFRAWREAVAELEARLAAAALDNVQPVAGHALEAVRRALGDIETLVAREQPDAPISSGRSHPDNEPNRD